MQTTDRNGGLTQATYDTNGERLALTDPTGAQTQATYDWMGRRSTSTVLDRYPTTTSVSTYNYTASSSDPGGAFLSSTVTQDGATTSYGYDNTGEQTQITDTADNTSKTAYDFLGRPATNTLPDNSSTTLQYDAAGDLLQTQAKDPSGTVLITTSATYDADGNRLSAVDELQHASTFTYNADGELTQEVQPVTAGSSVTISFGYDAAGNRTRYTDGRGNNWIYTYNPWNLQESVIEPTTSTYTTAAQSTVTTAYDADGRPVTQTQPGGVSITAGYDNNGNLTSQSGSGADVATASRTFGYDGDGRITSASTTAVGTSGSAGYQPATSETYTYNDRGELLTASGAAGSSSFSYNADALMTQRNDAAGTTSYGYNGADQLSTVTDATTNTIAQYTYNTLDQVKQIQYGTGGNLRQFGYNTLHQLTGDTLTNAAGTTTLAAINYGYDNNGNLTSKTTTGFAGASSNTYSYDFANRLTSWISGSATTNYAYDASGNRTQVGANVYAYDARDELTGDGVNTYTYTARGTMSSQTSASGVVNYASDAFNQQISVGAQSYGYDASGRVITDTSSGGGTRTLQYSGTGNDVASDGADTYAWDPSGALVGIGAAASGGGTTPGSGTLAYTDQHTDVVGDFTATGTALSGSTAYDPLGNVLTSSNRLGSVGYQSAWTDNATGKANMAARWYNPATGQFMNKDTAQVSPVPNSAQANPFAYVGDDPLTATDPTGHCGGFFGWVCSAASAVNRDIIQPAWHWTDRNIVQPVEHAAEKAYHWVKNGFEDLMRGFATALHALQDAFAYAQRQLAALERKLYSAGRRVYHQAVKRARAVVHVVTTAYHRTISAAHKAISSTVTFVKHHAAAITSIVVGAGVFLGCSALTGGIGAIGCAALAGAASSAVSYSMTCGQSKSGCTALGAVEAIGIGAVGGAVGGALAGPLGGKLVSEALDGVLPDVAGSALVGGFSGGGAGATSGALGYAAGCGSSREGCSWSGLGSASLHGAEQGAATGGIAGAVAPVAGRAISSLRGGCHSFTGNTPVLLADGTTKPIDQIKVGDRITDAVPGEMNNQAHTVSAVIVTATDHDFADVAVTPTRAAQGENARQGRIKSTLSKAAVGLAAALVAVTGTATTASAATRQPATVAVTNASAASADVAAHGGTLTTTFHHPFYDLTQAAFVEAQHLHAGDVLQTPTGTAEVTAVRLYHANTTTYDLTIGALHTYYVLAGSVAALVHNCGNGGEGAAASEPEVTPYSIYRTPHSSDLDPMPGLCR
ncbi:hypothetical protein KGA66_09265 [Actinocrinis puniceicyclus]|uniref:Teneurin-like YD-shell domain-containing protein n=1 Tax=Actinocrinis puniceicyclus TaxID=977794 RepID=A0A8J8BDX8_9ACTN|nr:RHS repeat-associated core domain-containing protein [Actinocrinis puniceicyclus]MBS2963234.1 hypothetical protein [Actinocrinis puniceicyclus]